MYMTLSSCVGCNVNLSTDITSLDSQSISASVSVCDNTACMVHVRWSEPFVSCGGSVSHYMLSVTPPTYDCQSGSGHSGSEFMTIETQYTLTVTANQTYNFNISVVNNCGDIGEPAEYITDIRGIKRSSRDFLLGWLLIKNSGSRIL